MTNLRYHPEPAEEANAACLGFSAVVGVITNYPPAISTDVRTLLTCYWSDLPSDLVGGIGITGAKGELEIRSYFLPDYKSGRAAVEQLIGNYAVRDLLCCSGFAIPNRTC